MKVSDFLRATQGLPIDGSDQILKIDDPIRKVSGYRTGDDLIVGFGGTKECFLDWLLNLWAWPVHYDVAGASLRAHPGALAEAKSFLPEIFDLAAGAERVLLGGHSQGGAHAVDVALELAARWPDLPIEVATFGSMPSLSLASAIAVASMSSFHRIRFTNYVLSGDPMGYVPWKLLGLGSPGGTLLLEPHRMWPDGRRHSPSAYFQALEPASNGLS